MGIAVIANFMLSQRFNNVATLIVPQISCKFTGQVEAAGDMSVGKNARNFH